MRRALVALGALLAWFALSFLPAWAESEEGFNAFEPDQLESHGWEERTFEAGFWGTEEVQHWCKSADAVTETDEEVLGLAEEPVQEGLETLVGKVSVHYSLDDPAEGVVFCINPEEDGEEEHFLCLGVDDELPTSSAPGGDAVSPQEMGQYCWDSSGVYLQGWFDDAIDAISDPVGSMVDSTLGQWITELVQGMRYYMAMALYWWILVPHADIEQSPAGVLWPPMLGLGMAIGIILLALQGIKMMFSRKAASVLVHTLKGLASFVVWCIVGVSFIGLLSHASEALTRGILDYTLDSAQIGCSRFHAEERQPDGMDLEYPSEEEVLGEGAADEDQARTNAETGRALGNCFAAQFAVHGAFAGAIMILFILGFLMAIIQAIILFVREAILPIMALLLPIAAAGQVGGTLTRRWLPNLLSMVMTTLAFKPMVALVFGVGFTMASLGNEFLDVVRGLVVLLIGVLAPAVMLKAFKPLATQGVEDMASAGSAVNTFVMGSQAGSTLGGWARSAAAGRQERREAARKAAHQGGGVVLSATKGAGAATGAASSGAALASGPVGWAAKTAQTVGKVAKGVGRAVSGGSAGPEAGPVRRDPGAGPAGVPHQGAGSGPGSQGGQHPHQGTGGQTGPQQHRQGSAPPPVREQPGEGPPSPGSSAPGAPEAPEAAAPPGSGPGPAGVGLREGPPPAVSGGQSPPAPGPDQPREGPAGPPPSPPSPTPPPPRSDESSEES